MNPKETTAEVRRCFALCSRLQDTIEEAVTEKRWNRSERMLVVASSFYGGTIAISKSRQKPKRHEGFEMRPPSKILTEALLRMREGPARRKTRDGSPRSGA